MVKNEPVGDAMDDEEGRYRLGPDVDLATEDVQVDGARLTDERAAEIAEETLAALRRERQSE